MNDHNSTSLKTFAATLAFLVLPLAGASAQSCPAPSTLIDDAEGAMAHIRYLADDQLEGRAVGSAGAHCAGDYLAAQFAALGLEPGALKVAISSPSPSVKVRSWDRTTVSSYRVGATRWAQSGSRTAFPPARASRES